MSVHKDLTGADLHEPKGADTATAGKVYVSDGAGSGVWTDASSIITNTAFTTGDLKPTHKVTADTSWIMWSDGTIGDGSSSASIRANADTSDLFSLYWTNYSNTLCPVYTSAGVASTRGASAAADYAAHKRIALPTGAGRALALAGSGSTLTTRTVGSTVGAETHTLSTSEIPSHTHVNTLSDPGHYHTLGSTTTAGAGAAISAISISGSSNITGTSFSGITLTNVAEGGGGSHKNMQPTTFINVMVKL